MLVARRFIVSGRVQGVGFRHFVAEAARTEGVHGWVRNRHDGSVEALVEGDLESVDRVEWAVRRGPPLSRVEGVDVSPEPATGRPAGFHIET